MEKWIIDVIAGYLIYMAFFIAVTSTANFKVYNLTPEQEAAVLAPGTDALTIINKMLILSSVNSGYAFASFVGGILTVVFLIAVYFAIKDAIPILGG